jgi:hypothetical protein
MPAGNQLRPQKKLQVVGVGPSEVQVPDMSYWLWMEDLLNECFKGSI